MYTLPASDTSSNRVWDLASMTKCTHMLNVREDIKSNSFFFNSTAHQIDKYKLGHFIF